jgi:hypothetical protein
MDADRNGLPPVEGEPIRGRVESAIFGTKFDVRRHGITGVGQGPGVTGGRSHQPVSGSALVRCHLVQQPLDPCEDEPEHRAEHRTCYGDQCSLLELSHGELGYPAPRSAQPPIRTSRLEGIGAGLGGAVCPCVASGAPGTHAWMGGRRRGVHGHTATCDRAQLCRDSSQETSDRCWAVRPAHGSTQAVVGGAPITQSDQ